MDLVKAEVDNLAQIIAWFHPQKKKPSYSDRLIKGIMTFMKADWVVENFFPIPGVNPYVARLTAIYTRN